ncbi:MULTISPECIES: colicin E3/pyocin S6 family cytotoxin [Rhodococcus]|jgi:hypothetical protein|uniref:colicin E3/pyocin S6 family cytotoxin n=1 Tax=Rhodococcus TaxID=1827 RepID=UPI0005DCDD9E|nr:MULTISPECIES: colicin E3/pyocin S6 family cytotoxin [Rhodococcus]KJF22352.1 Colicin-E3 [Rhodococcus sp. AD45]
MAPITMDPAVLIDAATQYKTVSNSTDSVIRLLGETLQTNWGCAGTDNAGAGWAASYDPAAFDAVAAGTNIVNAFSKLHDLLAATGVNHANTERSNTNPPEPPEGPASQLPTVSAPAFYGALGGDTDPPLGWELITAWLQGHMWPNGNPDKLKALGRAWRTAAEGLRDANDATGTAWVALEELDSDEMPQVLAQLDNVFVTTNAVADQYDTLAAACDEWAQTIEEAHRKIFDIVGKAIIVGALAGAVTALFTLGAGTVAAAGATGSVIAASVVGVLGAVDAVAVAVVGGVAAAGAAAVGAVNELQPLLEANPTTFNANTGGGGNTLGYYPAPRHLPGFPNAKLVKRMNERKRWKDDKGNIYEWDYQHGAVEKYNKNGTHLGEYDANTGTQTKPADPSRRTER